MHYITERANKRQPIYNLLMSLLMTCMRIEVIMLEINRQLLVIYYYRMPLKIKDSQIILY